MRGCLGGKPPGGGCGRDDKRLEEGSFSHLLLNMGADCSTSRATILLIVELYTVYSIYMSVNELYELGLGSCVDEFDIDESSGEEVGVRKQYCGLCSYDLAIDGI